MAGRLYLVGTPIGHLGDVSARVRDTLGGVALIAAEDTRRTGMLLKHLGISGRLTSYHDHNERRKAPALIEALERGDDVAVVSDAGVPGIADPGWHVVRAAIERGIAVTAIPGPTAFVLALVTSGLPAHRFAFEGYLPRKPGPRRKRLAHLRNEERTMVFYETPHKIMATLGDMVEALGDRRAALARELTKQHEETLRGRLPELLAQVSCHRPRGEYVVVIAGAAAEEAGQDDGPGGERTDEFRTNEGD